MRTIVSAMMPQRGAVVWNPVPNVTPLLYTKKYIQVWLQRGVALGALCFVVLWCVVLCCGVVWCAVVLCAVWCGILFCVVLRCGVM